jgi:hypothetical protein
MVAMVVQIINEAYIYIYIYSVCINWALTYAYRHIPTAVDIKITETNTEYKHAFLNYIILFYTTEINKYGKII